MTSELESHLPLAKRPGSAIWWALPLLVVVSALVLTVCYLQIQWPGRWMSGNAPPLKWSGSALELRKGQGIKGVDSLTIEELDQQEIAVASVVPKTFRARDYPAVIWDIENVLPGSQLIFVWRDDQDLERFRSRVLQPVDGRVAPLEMGADENWRGNIIGLALFVKGRLAAPIKINGVSLRPFNVVDELNRIGTGWFQPEGWSARSINFVDANADQQNPPLMLALCATLTLALVLCLAAVKRGWVRSYEMWLWGILFAGWFALDARWEWNLLRQLDATWQQYAGKSWLAKHRAAEDGALFEFIQQVKLKLAPGSRVLFFADDPYTRGKGAYYLYPFNVIALRDFSEAGKLKAGDYMVSFGQAGVDYDGSKQMLKQNSGAEIAADRLSASEGNFLVKVR